MSRTILFDLPPDVKGFVKETDDGSQIVILNSRLTREANITTYAHEVSHVDDFGKDINVSLLEKHRHK